MSYLKSALDIHYECPRGLSAADHIVDYHHRTNLLSSRVLCLRSASPRELKELYPLVTNAQQQFWNEYHAHCERAEKERVKDA